MRNLAVSVIRDVSKMWSRPKVGTVSDIVNSYVSVRLMWVLPEQLIHLKDGYMDLLDWDDRTKDEITS